jgi:hypothetical protein
VTKLGMDTDQIRTLASRVSGAPSQPGAASHPGGVAANGTPAAASAPVAHSSGPAGTQDYSAQKSIDAARSEVGTSRPTGWDQPGECVKSVQRWIDDSGGHFGGGGVVSSYQNSGAVEVPMANIKPGDVLQFTSTTDPDSWAAGPVHTVLVAGVDHDGHYDIIQSNSPYGYGTVTEVQDWTPKSADNMEWRAWRFAADS